MNKIIIDLDNTIAGPKKSSYADCAPNNLVIEKLRDYRASGFSIVVFTARNMRTYEGNIGKININTLPVIADWLDRNNVPYDEILVGKPWCGPEGFYVDDRALRPDEFVTLNPDEIAALLSGSVTGNDALGDDSA